MEYIKKKVKGYKKSYVTSKGVRKNTKPNLTIYLGANTPFKPDQELILMDMQLFNLIDSLLDLTNTSKDNIPDKIESLKQYQTTKPDNTKNSLEIKELKDEIKELNILLDEVTKEKDNYNNELHKSKNLIIRKEREEKEYLKLLGYYEKLEVKRGAYGLLDRVRNKDPKQEIPRPETPLLTNDNKPEQ